ncbi:zinc phosphodiesterase elac protein [Anaeramoeba flamelloides]|uniref:ribonuclease Z n=1 Tax=Anaeramoeba flamelloides TaxID=1746091 RepID=A0ABQ8YMK3_9EUKA|nr:zinc phosphodiesterase elac protein [Anaeramoeba flamelloides]
MTVYVQILGDTSSELYPNLLLSFNGCQYLFNCSEGSQRLSITNKQLKLTSLSTILFTNIHTRNFTGLPGTILSFSNFLKTNKGTPKLNIHGPKNTHNLLSAITSITHGRDLKIQSHEFHKNGEIFQDTNKVEFTSIILKKEKKQKKEMKIEKLTMVKEKEKEEEKEKEKEKEKEEEEEKEIQKEEKKKNPMEESKETQTNKETENTFKNYQGNEETKTEFVDQKEGKQESNNERIQDREYDLSQPAGFKIDGNQTETDNKEAIEIEEKQEIETKEQKIEKELDETPTKVKRISLSYIVKLPDRPGQLQKGETITLPDNRIITPEQVIGKSRPLPKIAVIDLTSSKCLKSFLKNKYLLKYQKKQEKKEEIQKNQEGKEKKKEKEKEKEKKVKGEEDGGKKVGEFLSFIFYFISKKNLQNEKFQKYISNYPKETQHVFIPIGSHTKSPTKFLLHSSQLRWKKLNLISPQIYPFRHNHLEWKTNLITEKFNKYLQYYPQNTIMGKHLLILNLFPEKKYGKDENSILRDQQEIDNNMKEIELLQDTIKSNININKKNQVIIDNNKNIQIEYKERDKDNNDDIKIPILDLQPSNNSEIKKNNLYNNSPNNENQTTKNSFFKKIIFFGTGATMPGKYNNVSSIFLKLTNTLSILLECGESTVAQFRKHFGNKFCKNICSVKLIWISHLHADHHLGILNFLSYRMICYKKLYGKLNNYKHPYIAISPHLKNYFLKINKITNQFQSYPIHIIESQNFSKFAIKKFKNITNEKVLKDNRLELFLETDSLTNIPTNHCENSNGIVILRNGKKIVYSGDTRPCESLIKAGANAEILIHEATFSSLEKSNAIKKKHSTKQEAINVGKKMGAKVTILTHIAHKYTHNPIEKIDLIRSPYDPQIIIACDWLVIKQKNLEYAFRSMSKIAEMFQSEERKRKFEQLENKKKLLKSKNQKRKRTNLNRKKKNKNQNTEKRNKNIIKNHNNKK